MFFGPPTYAVINHDVCIGCGACVPECPGEAIYPDGDKYSVDRDKCGNTDCNGECSAVCPVDAISFETITP